ncbi:hypothetical protein Dimus_037781, partial [Dionaea muscipula]
FELLFPDFLLCLPFILRARASSKMHPSVCCFPATTFCGSEIWPRHFSVTGHVAEAVTGGLSSRRGWSVLRRSLLLRI